MVCWPLVTVYSVISPASKDVRAAGLLVGAIVTSTPVSFVKLNWTLIVELVLDALLVFAWFGLL